MSVTKVIFQQSLKKKRIPGQVVINKLEISASPDVLIGISRLERVLISKIILFKKVTITPKGNFPKLKGSICNVPIDTVDFQMCSHVVQIVTV